MSRSTREKENTRGRGITTTAPPNLTETLSLRRFSLPSKEQITMLSSEYPAALLGPEQTITPTKSPETSSSAGQIEFSSTHSTYSDSTSDLSEPADAQLEVQHARRASASSVQLLSPAKIEIRPTGTSATNFDSTIPLANPSSSHSVPTTSGAFPLFPTPPYRATTPMMGLNCHSPFPPLPSHSRYLRFQLLPPAFRRTQITISPLRNPP